MSRINRPVGGIKTHEGATAKIINAEQELRRSVMACMLWEKTFYENGEDIAARIVKFVPLVDAAVVAEIAIDARSKANLRHVPLLIAREMARHAGHKSLVSTVLEQIIQRPDEINEFLSIYWKDGRCPISAQVKKGLAKAFQKFNEYQLAKWNKDSSIKLRDVLFMCHAKPKDKEQEALWKRLVEKELQTPDTWEVALSSGADKKESWERLIAEGKLGGLALLRNLRNMEQVDVDRGVIAAAIGRMQTERILPFRFISAARHAPQLEPSLETAMLKCLSGRNKMPGKTILLVDVSGSMDSPISEKSDLTRLDAACGLAILARELCESIEIHTFSQSIAEIPPRRGFALRDAIVNSQPHMSTYLGAAIRTLAGKGDRLIVFTDEQSHDVVPDPDGWKSAYMVNVASCKNGVGYYAWHHVDGFSEAIFDYIMAKEG
jgi:60 kDa SS-A/Ro ribonucleoprotein